jgi:hypothetical protein
VPIGSKGKPTAMLDFAHTVFGEIFQAVYIARGAIAHAKAGEAEPGHLPVHAVFTDSPRTVVWQWVSPGFVAGWAVLGREVFTRMVEVVDPRCLCRVDGFGWNPLGAAGCGVAGGCGDGGPLHVAVADEPVMRSTCEGQLVGVGVAAVGPFIAVVCLTEVSGFRAARMGAADIAGVQDDSLIGGGDAFSTTQIQGPPVGVVEDREVVVGVGGHPDQVVHRQQTPTTGEHRWPGNQQPVATTGRIRLSDSVFQILQRGGGHHRHR